MKNLGFWIPVLALGFAIYYFNTAYTGETVRFYQLFILAVASVISNFFVLFYHYTVPPHPKFLLLTPRKISIRVHVISGSIELFCGIVAMLSSNPAPFATIMAIAAFFHVGAASYQTPIVFGAKAIMHPLYIFIIGLHLFSAINLVIDPTSTTWIVNTFLVLNTYVWVRVFLSIFLKLDIFEERQYTVAIILACTIIAPAVLGPAANLYLVVFVGGYILLYKLVYDPNPAEFGAFFTESSRYSLIDEEAKALWQSNQISDANVPVNGEQADRELAQTIFNKLDKNSSGELDQSEVADILFDWKAPPRLVQAFVKRIGTNGKIDFSTFYKSVWKLGSVRSRLKQDSITDQKISAREQAKQVFNRLDLDQSGKINYFELQMLLIEWGLPYNEVDAYMAKFDDGDQKLSFEEFFTRMKPIWKYGFEFVVQRR